MTVGACCADRGEAFIGSDCINIAKMAPGTLVDLFGRTVDTDVALYNNRETESQLHDLSGGLRQVKSMSFASSNADPIICHCLGVAESEIRGASDFGGCQTVSDVKETTEAGSGCTSCHRRILALLQESQQAQVAAPQA